LEIFGVKIFHHETEVTFSVVSDFHDCDNFS